MEPTTTKFERVHGGKWTATVETPNGPLTAIGDSIAEAQAALEALLVLSRTVEVTRRN
jgi:hypothetical protein